MRVKQFSADPASEVGRFLEIVESSDLAAIETMSVLEARQSFKERARKASAEPVHVRFVSDNYIPLNGRSLALRTYSPSEKSRNIPLVVYFHGGGFVIGDLDTHDSICRKICVDTDAIVISVAYRLAPEYPHPAPVRDARESFDYIYSRIHELNVDADKVFVGGDSAGGTLAAIVAREDASNGKPRLAGQILIYPAIDHCGKYRSRSEFRNVFPISRPTINWFLHKYIREAGDLWSRDVCPGRFLESQWKIPGLVLTAGADPLRDEAEAYGEFLKERTSATRVIRYEDALHGFLGMDLFFSAAAKAHQDIATFIEGTTRVPQL